MAQNREMLIRTAVALGPLCSRMVFTGGAVTELLITEPGAPPVRATEDVDVIVNVIQRGSYHELMPELAERGFHPDPSSKVICRFRNQDLLLDVMPTDSSVLGFTNRWYEPSVKHAESYQLDAKTRVSLISAPYFLGTKFVAFRDRGQSDFFTSHDFEDIIVVLDGRPTIVDEVAAVASELKAFLRSECAKVVADARHEEGVSACLPGDKASQRRRPMILGRLGRLAQLPPERAPNSES